jgi:UDP-hydrolysing UDP-N-acetyl-D-glucosamine 2-epimerase
MIRIGFFTGWRCEYGLTVGLLKLLDSDPDIELLIYPNGLHLLNNFGHTVDEIEKDGFTIGEKIYSYSENGDEKAFELTNSVNMINEVMKKSNLDGIIICGDRIEAYAAALAAHFNELPVFHIGGGVITKGAVDDVYRYNITNLATTHFVTCKSAYKRLMKFEILKDDDIHFVGSTAIDRIMKFKKNPISIRKAFSTIQIDKFALMTFHPVTKGNEPISDLMNISIQKIINKKFDVLITYPNNDSGYEKILSVVKQWESNSNVFLEKNLGSELYCSALNDCAFVIGNSSSGVIEAPYFKKPVLNIGSRQEGREKDVGVYDIPADETFIMKGLELGFQKKWPPVEYNNIYGKGNAGKKILKIVKDKLNHYTHS